MLKFELVGFKEVSRKLNQSIEKEKQKFFNPEMQRLKKLLVKATPIDTGYARSRWVYNKEDLLKISFSFKNRFFISFTDITYTFTNDAPYIQYLNQGSSKQAPAFFIEKTLLSQGYIPKKL